MSRLSAADRLLIATPCGICQERLYHWGYGVEVAVPRDDDPGRWQMRTLGELQPYHWVKSLLSNDPATTADHRDPTGLSGSG